MLSHVFKPTYSCSPPLTTLYGLHDVSFELIDAVKASPFKVSVNVDSDDETLQYGIDESYTITVSSDSTAVISAPTVYGAMYGMSGMCIIF